jgi:hypothetical protein
MDFSPNPLYLFKRYRRRFRSSVNGSGARRFESLTHNQVYRLQLRNPTPASSILPRQPFALILLPLELAVLVRPLRRQRPSLDRAGAEVERMTTKRFQSIRSRRYVAATYRVSNFTWASVQD